MRVVSSEAAKHVITYGAASQAVMLVLKVGEPVLDAPVLVDEQPDNCLDLGRRRDSVD